MLSGKVAPVSFGPSIVFQALLSSEAGPDGKAQFYIAIPQIAELFSVPQKNAQREFKALLGEDSPFLKMKTDLNSKAVNVLTFVQFEALILELVCKGNSEAKEFSKACIGLSLYQRACDSFGIKFEIEDRSAWLVDRAAGKIARNQLTDAIKAWLDLNNVPDAVRRFAYSNASDLLNIGLTGKKASCLVAELGISKDSLRDRLTAEALYEYRSIEKAASRAIRQGIEPMQAVREALRSNYATVLDRPFK